MYLKIHIFITVYSLVACCAISHITENFLIKYIIKHIKHSPRFRLMTIHSRSPERLSSTSSRIMKSLVNEFPSLVVNLNELSNPLANEHLSSIRIRLRSRSQRRSLNIFFIDRNFQEKVEQTLIGHLSSLVRVSLQTPRPQVIIFLLTDAKCSKFKGFFAFSWYHDFLDVIVIELVQPPLIIRLLASGPQHPLIFVHQYNPFNGTYFESTLTEEAEHKALIVHKLDDLQGYELKTGMFDDIPLVMIERDYEGDDAWSLAKGVDVLVARTLSERLNFTAKLRVVIADDNPNLRGFNFSRDYIDKALENEDIDFAVNFYGMLGTHHLEELTFEPSIFLYPYSSNLIVKQHGKSVVKLSRNVMVIAAITIATLLIFCTVTRLLRLNPRLWTVHNITSILTGVAIPTVPRKIHERILVLSIFVTSSALSVNVLEQLLDVYLWQNLFPDLNTLQDVVQAGVVPSITKNSKRAVFSYDDMALKHVLKHSTTIPSEEQIANCIDSLINSNAVNGCEVDRTIGNMLAKGFADHERGWIIRFVDEPIVQPCWTAMRLTRSSPYVGRFNQIMGKLRESGLLNQWFQSMMRNFTFKYKNFFGDKELHFQSDYNEIHKQYFLKNEKTHIHNKIILILLAGHAISCMIFVCEFIVRHGQRKISRRRANKFALRMVKAQMCLNE